MSLAPSHEQLQLPVSLESQLLDFRRRVWTVKMTEAVYAVVSVQLIAFLSVFALDRLWDTPSLFRLAILLAAVAGWALAPLALYRWVWRRRRLDQLAMLLSRKLPHVGDHLLGVIELTASQTDQTRSRALCQAAIEQVAKEAERRDFRQATPNARRRLWGSLCAIALAGAAALAVLAPAAAGNAWARFLAPWGETPRYTFAAVESLPAEFIVPHGESFTVTATLADSSRWRPAAGEASLGAQQAVAAQLRDGRYEFQLPPQITAGWLSIKIGDARQRVRIEPTLRPELSSLMAKIKLPGYLGRSQPLEKDVRGGAISLVKGSEADFIATISRELATAKVDGQNRPPAGAKIASLPSKVAKPRKIEFQWRDNLGLQGKEPFSLSLTPRDDEAPSLACEGLPRRLVVLDSEQLSFRVKAQDDFGVKRVGMQWQGLPGVTVENPADGERVLGAGGADKVSLELAGAFSAKSLGIEPQPIELRLFVEDYFPGRERVYSPAYVLYVLNAEQHAIWMTEQLSKWHRRSLEVRDREMQLYEENKRLRDLDQTELAALPTRRRIDSQAAAERANGRRLRSLTAGGKELLRQAARNPEFGVGHLEKWAEMLQILEDISANRMPTVADLLKQGAQAKSVASKASPSSPKAGQVRSSQSGAPGDPAADDKKPKPPGAPQVVDAESSQLSPADKENPPAGEKKPSRGSLGLAGTTLGGGPSSDSCPVGDKIEEAVEEQRELLAEFDRVADELNNVLANLEGSTLVKRLKAASRMQYTIGGKISDQVSGAFGRSPGSVAAEKKSVLAEMSDEEEESSYKVSLIMDDMGAYFERRRFVQFKTVLEDMRERDVIGALRQLGDDIRKENGVSIAQCEFWSDTLDRWAEDLVDPASGGS